MILLTALLMFEASQLKQTVLPIDHPKAYLQHIAIRDATARILDLTSTLPDGFIAGINNNSTLHEVVQEFEIQRDNKRVLGLMTKPTLQFSAN